MDVCHRIYYYTEHQVRIYVHLGAKLQKVIIMSKYMGMRGKECFFCGSDQKKKAAISDIVKFRYVACNRNDVQCLHNHKIFQDNHLLNIVMFISTTDKQSRHNMKYVHLSII